MIKSVKDLEVYNLSFEFAMSIFNISLSFPKEEKYSLTDQIRRSSRSIFGNIAEGWGKRKYIRVFKRHLIDSIGSLEETKSWLDFCLECNYISIEIHEELFKKSETIGSKLFKLHENWKY